jgi:hypothetical protein
MAAVAAIAVPIAARQGIDSSRGQRPLQADELGLGSLSPGKLRKDRMQAGVACKRKVGKLATSATVRSSDIELSGTARSADANLRKL